MAAPESALAGLSQVSAEQIRRVTKFFTSKAETSVKTVSADFQDARELLHEEEYSRDQVEEHFENLQGVVEGAIRSESKNQANLFVVILKSLLQDAESQGASLEVDPHMLDDARTLQEVERIRFERRLEPAEMKAQGKSGRGQLLSIKDEHGDLVRKNGMLDSTVGQLEEKVRRMQEQTNIILREKLQLQSELDEARRRFDTFSGHSDRRAQEKEAHYNSARQELEDAKGAFAERTKETVDLMRKVESLKLSLQEAEEENNTRLNQSKQVQQLRKLMNQKNDQIQDLRRRLEKYEPDTLGADEGF